jgi:hypothetical protein
MIFRNYRNLVWQIPGQILGNEPRSQVISAAGGSWDDHSDGPVGITRSSHCHGWDQQSHSDAHQQGETKHFLHSISSSFFVIALALVFYSRRTFHQFSGLCAFVIV